MNLPIMVSRKLQNAWSLSWGVAAVSLCVLWVRSYWHADDVVWTRGGNMYGLESACGSIRPFFNGTDSWPDAYWISTERIAESRLEYDHSTFGWDAQDYPTYFMAYCPHWIPAIVATVFAALPWIHWAKRFSLRTLLVATTLVATGLGLAVWAAR
jgi:hypothetical protein